ncbi:hypothetical protein QYF36_003771 [Acer negundo]|nr:hypothetical protein QYF36_003771 [Acer negundo]
MCLSRSFKVLSNTKVASLVGVARASLSNGFERWQSITMSLKFISEATNLGEVKRTPGVFAATVLTTLDVLLVSFARSIQPDSHLKGRKDTTSVIPHCLCGGGGGGGGGRGG